MPQGMYLASLGNQGNITCAGFHTGVRSLTKRHLRAGLRTHSHVQSFLWKCGSVTVLKAAFLTWDLWHHVVP